MKLYDVLLVDDNDLDNFIHENVINDLHIARSITTKNSGLEALDYLKKLDEEKATFPDLIFLDIRMPKMDGFEFLEQYRQLPSRCKDHCAIFMLSSSMDPRDIKKAEQYQYVKRYLYKPLTDEILSQIAV
jgi:CheY-like chemotaxis protein